MRTPHRFGLESGTISRRGFVAGSATVAATALLPSPLHAQTPIKGGNFRVAILGGGPSDTLDANSNVTQTDTARVLALYQPLATFGSGGVLQNVLAESFEPNADATEWTVRLKKDIVFHNRKTLSAEDVAFTIRRITDPKSPLTAAPLLAPVNREGMKVLDPLTLRIPMNAPFSFFDEVMADYNNISIVPVGYDPSKPVGTGPFKFESFTPAQQSVFTRHADYWGTAAHLDTLTIIDSFANETAAFNALQGGQIDAFASAPLSLAKQIEQSGAFKLLKSEVGQWTPITMRVDTAPFNNPDVRMAMRLLVDREQIIKIALNGYGLPGNDICAVWGSARSDFKRTRDVEKAKALLKKAGHESLTIELTTSDIATGVVATAQIFARQAAEAGVTVKVNQVPPDVFFGAQYLKWPMAQDFWSPKPYLAQIGLGLLPSSPYNDTSFNDPEYNALYKQALSEIDRAKRAVIEQKLQTIEFERGGNIISSFNQIVDILAPNVNGLEPGVFLALGDYDYAKVWLA